MPRASRTYKSAIDAGMGLLEESGAGSARGDAKILLSSVLGIGRAELASKPAATLAAPQFRKFISLVGRRAKGEPVAMILGEKEFYGRMFRIGKSTLVPRPDSETLIDAAMAALPDRRAKIRILDMGTGSGCLLLTLMAEYGNARGVGIDVSASALKFAYENERALGLAGRAEFSRLDWRRPRKLNGRKFDLIISNPPYVKSGDISRLARDIRDFEPAAALDGGADGLDCYRAIAAASLGEGLLAPRGRVFLEIGKGQSARIGKIFAAAGFEFNAAYNDLAGITRVLEFGA
ncbi:MAG: peptide chain release factor N(5)-glutamine methyltransferase [Rickettsiales bacterium]|jgi:release factor glutamine methyltransferase|nr:peptide chain release factor N(5)-glutamine methyltransferase [Rickettsiales bacterium]